MTPVGVTEKNLVNSHVMSLLDIKNLIKPTGAQQTAQKGEQTLNMIQKGFLHEYACFILQRFRTMYVNIEENHAKVFNIWNP